MINKKFASLVCVVFIGFSLKASEELDLRPIVFVNFNAMTCSPNRQDSPFNEVIDWKDIPGVSSELWATREIAFVVKLDLIVAKIAESLGARSVIALNDINPAKSKHDITQRLIDEANKEYLQRKINELQKKQK